MRYQRETAERIAAARKLMSEAASFANGDNGVGGAQHFVRPALRIIENMDALLTRIEKAV